MNSQREPSPLVLLLLLLLLIALALVLTLQLCDVCLHNNLCMFENDMFCLFPDFHLLSLSPSCPEFLAVISC